MVFYIFGFNWLVIPGILFDNEGNMTLKYRINRLMGKSGGGLFLYWWRQGRHTEALERLCFDLAQFKNSDNLVSVITDVLLDEIKFMEQYGGTA